MARRVRRNGRARPGMLGGIATIADRAWRIGKYVRKRTQRKFKKSPTVRDGVTAHYDRQTQYVKRSMPKYKKRQWKRFVRKVKAATQDRGTISEMFNATNPLQTDAYVGGIRKQAIQCVHLYGNNGVNSGRELGAHDLSQIRDTVGYLAEKNSISETNAKITFKSAVLDVTILNEGVAGTPGTNYGGSLEVDIYHIVYPSNKQQLFSNGLANAFAVGTVDTSYTGVSSPKIELADRGATPFEIGQAISELGCKILRKTKHTLPFGASTTFQIRDPKNRTFELNDSFVGTFKQNKMTQSLLIVAKPQSTENDATVFGMWTSATRSYKYTIEGITNDASYYHNLQA